MKLLILLLLLAPPALACKALAPPACEEKERIPLHEASFARLFQATKALQNELSQALPKKRPKGATSCFNSGLAIHYAGHLRESARKQNGKICASSVPLLKTSTENLLNADAAEWKAVRDEKSHGRLAGLAKEARSALEEFLHQH